MRATLVTEDKCPAKLNGNPPPECFLPRSHTGKHEAHVKHGVLLWEAPVSDYLPNTWEPAKIDEVPDAKPGKGDKL